VHSYFGTEGVNMNKTMGDFKVGVSVYCTKCTLNTGVNTNFEITHGPVAKMTPTFENTPFGRSAKGTYDL
jgi:hypothetical protein